MKLYADEDGAGSVRALSNIVISCLARVEVVAAIWRKNRMSQLSADDTTVLVARFTADYHGKGAAPGRFSVLWIPESVLLGAARQVAAHGLRAVDAVQLASAVVARLADPGCGEFACFDHDLRAAAAVEGFKNRSS